MARTNLSIPHERRKAKLRGEEIRLRVKQAEVRERLGTVRTELRAMRPVKPKTEM